MILDRPKKLMAFAETLLDAKKAQICHLREITRDAVPTFSSDRSRGIAYAEAVKGELKSR